MAIQQLQLSGKQTLALEQLRQMLAEIALPDASNEVSPTAHYATCGGSCLVACDSTCWVTCSGNCDVSCQVGCQGGCTGSCTGQCGGFVNWVQGWF